MTDDEAAWYEAELQATVEETNELAQQLRRLAQARGPEVAAEALGDVMPDVAGHLAECAGALQVLAREAPSRDAAAAGEAMERLLRTHAFLRSALKDRTEEAQSRRAQAEERHFEQLRAAAREAAGRVTVALNSLPGGAKAERGSEVREAARDAAASLLEALPVLWVGRTIVVRKDEEHDPSTVIAEAQHVLAYLGHWLAPDAGS